MHETLQTSVRALQPGVPESSTPSMRSALQTAA